MSAFATELVAAWWAIVAPLSVRVVVLALLVALVDALLPRRTWPELRHALWMLVPLRLIVPPSVELPHVVSSLPTPGFVTLALEPPGSVPAFASPVVGVWAVGVAAGAALVAWRAWRASVVRRDAGPVPVRVAALARRLAGEAGVRRRVRVASSRRATMPCVIGVFRPCILLPHDAIDGPHVEHALRHEIEHVRRWDGLVSLATTLVTVLYWFHPAAWIALVRLRALRELSCDRAVAVRLGDAVAEYRRTLLWFAARAQGIPAGALGFTHPEALILARLRRLEREQVDRPWTRRLATGALSSVLVLAALASAESAEAYARGTADVMRRPPGCLLLRHEVLRRLAAERAAATSDDRHRENEP